MKQMGITDREWAELKCSIEAGKAPVGTFLVGGPSEAITGEARAVLLAASRPNYHVRYFLCSNRGAFRTPCFFSVANEQMQPERLDAFAFLQEKRPGRERCLQLKVEELERSALHDSSLSQMIVIEYLLPPVKLDLSFTLHILQSALSQHIPIIMLYHQQDPASTVQSTLPAGSQIEDIVSLLYLCGGRVQQPDWQKLVAHLPEAYDQFIASRSDGTDTWICYANRQIAEEAENIYQAMDQGRRHQLTRHVLHMLQHNTGYPLLTIASETGDLEAMLSVYSRQTIEATISEPEGLIRYYERLRHVAQMACNNSVSGSAYTLAQLAYLLLDDMQAVRVYKRLRGVLPDTLDLKTRFAFWVTLGQTLALLAHPEAWEYAAECFRLGKECLKKIDQRSRAKEGLSLIAAVNGEALIAYKLHQYEKAQELVEFVLAQMKDTTNHFRIHVLTNLGDVLLRSPDRREAALDRYGEALLLSTKIVRKLQSRSTLEQVLPYRQRAALKLGNILIELERYEEAIQILERLLRDFAKVTGRVWIEEKYTQMVLKAKLTLAQAYLKAGQERRAALCYWSILRYPCWLDVTVLRDVATRLCTCRPALHELLRRRIERVVSEQEMIMADVMQIQEIFTEVRYSLEHEMVA
jgi:tetratricopeptide (TPR) repeat protein